MNDKTELLEKHFTSLELSKGEYFVREGEYSKKIAYVDSGLLHSYQTDNNGEAVTTTFFQAGSFCGSYYSFYRQAPALDSVRAITDSRILTIGYDKLQSLFNTQPIFNKLGRLALEDVCIAKDIRLSKMLRLDAKERYLWFIKEYPAVAKKSPLKYIASFLGMTPESLSRIRKELIS